MSIWAAGADGCRGGWICVFTADAAFRVRFVPAVADILVSPENPAAIAIDIPIGLPQRAETGGRRCDVELRARLGARQSSVFAVPARAAVGEEDYRRACERAFAHSDPPRRVSKQCFHIFPKIREVDAVITPELQSRLFECHPEGAFWAMNGGPLTEPKKLKSRPYPPGIALRRQLLQRHGFPAAFLAQWPRPAAEDDFLDACACAWTARRKLGGEAFRFPDDPARDTRGLRMEIWV